MSVLDHAKRELALLSKTRDRDEYDGLLDKSVLELIEVFSKQGHSGASAAITIALFEELASYKNLTPLTTDKDEWYYHGPDVWGRDGGIWQNIRNGEAFSKDGGKTYYLLSDKDDTVIHHSVNLDDEKTENKNE